MRASVWLAFFFNIFFSSWWRRGKEIFAHSHALSPSPPLFYFILSHATPVSSSITFSRARTQVPLCRQIQSYSFSIFSRSHYLSPATFVVRCRGYYLLASRLSAKTKKFCARLWGANPDFLHNKEKHETLATTCKNDAAKNHTLVHIFAPVWCCLACQISA